MSSVIQINFDPTKWAAGTGVGTTPGANGYDAGSVFLDKDGVTAWAFEYNGNAGFARFNLSDGSIVHQGAMFGSPGSAFLQTPANSSAGTVFFDQSADGSTYFVIDNAAVLYKFTIGVGTAGNLLDGYCTNPVTFDLFNSLDNFPHASQIESTCSWFDSVTNTNYYAINVQSGSGSGHQFGFVLNTDTMTFVGDYDFAKVGIAVFADKNGDCWFVSSDNVDAPTKLTMARWHPADGGGGGTGGTLTFSSPGTGPQAVNDSVIGFFAANWAGYIPSSHSVILAGPSTLGVHDTESVVNLDLVALTRNALHVDDFTFFYGATPDPGWSALKRGQFASNLLALPGNLNPDTAQLSGIINGVDPTSLTLVTIAGDLVVTYQPTSAVLGSPVYLVKGLAGASSYNITSTINGSGVTTPIGNYTGSQKSPFSSIQWVGVPPTTGNIRVVKSTAPSSSPQLFTFHPDWEGGFSLISAQSHLSPDLAPGSYSITEDAVPNWTTTTSIDPTAIVVTAGVTTVITFTNTFTSPPPPGPVCYADGIIPTGAIDGVNTSYTLPSTPNPPGSLILESDTSLLAPGVGFTLSFVLSGTQLKLAYPPKTSLVAWYRTICGSQIPPLYKLNPDQAFDDNAFTSTPTAINSTYFTYGFVNAAKSAQNPLLGFHRKRFSEIQMNVNGSGQFIVTTFPNYILKKDLSYNPYAYVVPPILLQTDPPDDLIRPLNSVGNRVYVKFETNAVGAAFDISKTILCGVMDSYNVVNPNV